MKTRIAILGDLAEDHGLRDVFDELVNTHLVFRVPGVVDYTEENVGWRAYIGTFYSREAALNHCEREPGQYQVVNLHQNQCETFVVADKQAVERETLILQQVQELWELTCITFQARFGRLMTEEEVHAFIPAQLRVNKSHYPMVPQGPEA